MLGLHSFVRWVVVGISLVAAIYFLLVMLKVLKGDKLDRVVMMVFTIGLDIQVLIGILHLVEKIFQNGFYPALLGHVVLMILALGVAHMSARWKKAERGLRARNNLIAIIVSLVLVFVGVASLPGGMSRWGM